MRQGIKQIVEIEVASAVARTLLVGLPLFTLAVFVAIKGC